MLLEEGEEPVAPHHAGRHLGPEVAQDDVRDPNVLFEDGHQGLVGPPLLEELERRQAQPFLEDLGGVRGGAARRLAPHVLVVGHGAGQGHRLALVTNGNDDDDVGKVGPPIIRIIHQVHVPLAHGGGREGADDPLDPGDEHPEVGGDGRGLGDGLAAGIEEGRRGVQALPDDARVAGLEEGELHLLGDHVERVPEHLEGDGVDGHPRPSAARDGGWRRPRSGNRVG